MYLISKHKGVVNDLKKDIEILRSENETLKQSNDSSQREITNLRQ